MQNLAMNEVPKAPIDISHSLSDDRTTIRLQAPAVDAALTVQQLDELVYALVVIRTNMVPIFPLEWPADAPVLAAKSPAWFCRAAVETDESLLSMRHPGLGWLHFALRKAEAAKLADLLKRQSERAFAPLVRN